MTGLKNITEGISVMTPEEFKQWRKDMGLTQTKAAEVLGVTRSAVAKWEMGERELSKTVLKLIDIYKENQHLLK